LSPLVAQVDPALIEMYPGPQGVYVGISDDGRGFTVPNENSFYNFSVSQPAKLGIWSMSKRAAILGGSNEKG
jgi:signal transduction histidine kinase